VSGLLCRFLSDLKGDVQTLLDKEPCCRVVATKPMHETAVGPDVGSKV